MALLRFLVDKMEGLLILGIHFHAPYLVAVLVGLLLANLLTLVLADLQASSTARLAAQN